MYVYTVRLTMTFRIESRIIAIDEDVAGAGQENDHYSYYFYYSYYYNYYYYSTTIRAEQYLRSRHHVWLIRRCAQTATVRHKLFH